MDRTEFKEYCLRALGKPVINIEISEDQVEDRVNEAIILWSEWHHDAVEERWVYYELTQDDIDNKFITIPDDTGIQRVQRIRPMYATGKSSNMFDPIYNINRQYFLGFKPFDNIGFFLKMTGLQETIDMLSPTPTFEYAMYKQRLYVNQDLESLGVGYKFAMYVSAFVSPDDYNKAFSDRWLSAYTIALLKKQWASNIKKYEQVQLLGGVMINGKELYDEAMGEIEILMTNLKDEYIEPCGFIIG